MGDGPLAGVRVLELGGIGPGPFAALQLAGMGADVVQLDRLDDVGGPDAAAALMGRGKRSVAVDLRTADGVRLVLGLAAQADIVVEGFRPGTAERLGLGPSECHARNPALVYGRMTGWGQHGPLASSAGHDINYISLTGALHAIGRGGQPPSVPLCLVGDLGGGAMFLVAGVLAALHEAGQTGCGQVVDAAIVDGAAALMQPIYEMVADGQWRDERGTNLLDSGRPWYDVYETRDGRYVSVGAIEDKFYAVFTELLGLTGAVADRGDPAGWPALRERIAQRFAERDRAHWEAVFGGTDACVAPVLSIGEAASHPHLVARQTVVADGSPANLSAAAAPRFGAHPPAAGRGAPRPGEQTREVLDSWLPDTPIEALLDRGVISQWRGPAG
ncbi:MAG TPA: CaiB/BaiF CoA-transferase family protein [Pseudonocardia sp.]|uniref:CaiB/BaiF CoA transferase family protein n=1 Tax=Pseudonocardia sp. TaxID=60912 RepID=UPI002C7A16B5|nr:CaiB/BaiF CoA-transferase family protein [Pseudonocardia sp.]HTF46219.1 CaiB/BaiF CoA-transferase family protein [Pseudonocardia sp.]